MQRGFGCQLLYSQRSLQSALSANDKTQVWDQYKADMLNQCKRAYLNQVSQITQSTDTGK